MKNQNLDDFLSALVERFNNNMISISLDKFCLEYAEFVKRNRAVKTYNGTLLVNRKLLGYFSPQRDIRTIKLKDAEDFLYHEKKSALLNSQNDADTPPTIKVVDSTSKRPNL